MEAVERRVLLLLRWGGFGLCVLITGLWWLQNGSPFSGTFASSVIPNCCSLYHTCVAPVTMLKRFTHAYDTHTRARALACTNTQTQSHPLVQYSAIHFKHIGLGKVWQCVSIIEKEVDGILAVCYSTVLQGCEPVHVLTWEISDCS
jgi:hypothetical protein